jgi:hypothetical protein
MAIVAAGALAVSGCAADSPMTNATLQHSNHVRVEPDLSDPTLIVARVQNVWDIGVDMERRADRHTVVLNMVRAQCGQPVIEREVVTRTGGIVSVRERLLYTLFVRCPNGAAQPVAPEG